MSKPIEIVADRGIPFLQGVLEPYAQVSYLPAEEMTPERVAHSDALAIRTRTLCNESLLGGSSVQMIATATIGFDHIDLNYCSQQGIEVVTAAGCNARGVLQYVVAALARLSQLRGWSPAERTLGVVGVGNVGRLVAHYGELLGFRVLRCDPPRARREGSAGFCSLSQLLSCSDMVTLHVPLIASGEDATRGMVNDDFFAQMRAGSTLINSSRGAVVEDEALLRALDRGVIADAVIDTWNHEPHPNAELFERATFATAHIAGYSLQGKAMATAEVVRALSRRFGWPLLDWYPEQVSATVPRSDLSWAEILSQMPRYFDIEAQSAELRAEVESFEQIRNNYPYRQEFF